MVVKSASGTRLRNAAGLGAGLASRYRCRRCVPFRPRPLAHWALPFHGWSWSSHGGGGLGMSSWLIPWIGVMGAVLAYSTTGLVYAGLMLWASDKVFPVSRSNITLIVSVILFLLAAVCQLAAAVHA